MKLKRKTNGVYFIDARLPDDNGALSRVRVSFETRDEGNARLQLADWLRGTHPKHPSQGGVIAPKGKAPRPEPVSSSDMTLKQWLGQCTRTIWAEHTIRDTKSAYSIVKRLSSAIPDDLLLAEVRSTHLAQLVEHMRAEGLAEGTIRRRITAVGAAMRHATETENPATGRTYLAAVPKMPKVTVRNVQDRVVSRDEEAAILECIDARHHSEDARPWWWFKALVIQQLDMGFRLGECLSCGPRSVRRKTWVDPVTGEAFSETFLGLDAVGTKSQRSRDVPVTRRVEALIPQLNSMAKAGRWYPWPVKSSVPWTMWEVVRRDMKAKGYDVDDVKQHTFRHTCATRLAEGGLDLVSLRDWLGHSDISITAGRYVHLMANHLHRGARILDAGTKGFSEQLGNQDGTLSTLRFSQPDGTIGHPYGAPAVN